MRCVAAEETLLGSILLGYVSWATLYKTINNFLLTFPTFLQLALEELFGIERKYL